MNDAETTTRTGRIVLLDSGCFYWVQQGRQSQVLCDSSVNLDSLKPGDWVEADLLTSPGDPTTAKTVRVVQPYNPASPFPPADSDWFRFHKDNALRFELVKHRHALLRGVRDYFEQAHFLEVDTPAMATCPGLETHLDAIEVRPRLTPEGHHETRWLITSPEYHMKRMLSAGFERIFQIGKAFRSGETGRWHNPEFTMLEWYRAFASWEDGLEDTIRIIESAAAALSKNGVDLPLDLSHPWPRMTIREAIEKWGGFDPAPWSDTNLLREKALKAGVSISDREISSADIIVRTLVEKVEPALPTHRPFVLTDYPDCMASLAQRSTDDPTVAERFEVYLGGVEIANGFGELTDAREQRRRFIADLEERTQMNLTTYPLDETFLGALEAGCPPATGVALGIDRLLLCLTGSEELEQTMAFPIVHA